MNYSQNQTVASKGHTLAVAKQRMDLFRFDKFNKLRFITEGLGAIGDLLDDNSGESVPRHPLTDRQRVGLIFALKGLVGGLEDCIDELDDMMGVVGDVLEADMPGVVGRTAS